MQYWMVRLLTGFLTATISPGAGSSRARLCAQRLQAGAAPPTGTMTAMSEGVSLRRRFDDGELPDIELATGPDGALQTWHPFSVGLIALIRFFVEEDPGQAPAGCGTPER